MKPVRIFVVGCSRSGTTVLQRVMAERFDLFTLPETLFFVKLVGNREGRSFSTTARHRTSLFHLASNVLTHTGLEWQGPRRSHLEGKTSEFVAELDKLAEGKAGWLEKTPSHVHYLEYIARLIPDALVVHIVREPKDTIASIRDAATRYPDSGWATRFHNVERAVDNWNTSMRQSSEWVGRPGHSFVSYEALVSETDATLNRLAGELGLRTMRTSAAPEVRASLDSSPWLSEAVDGAIAPARSKWMTALSAEERERAEALIAPIPRPLAEALAGSTPSASGVTASNVAAP